MQEPTTAASGLTNYLTGVSIGLAGYVTGDTVAIILGATFGALWAIGTAQTGGRLAGLVLLVKLIGTALALTGFLAYVIEANGGAPAARTLTPTAFFVAAIGTRWPQLIEAFVDALVKVVGGLVRLVARRLGITPGEDR